MIVDVQRLWCTGYNPAYKGDVTPASASPIGADSRSACRGCRVHAEDGGIDCKRIMRKALTDFFIATRAMFANPNIRPRFVRSDRSRLREARQPSTRSRIGSPSTRELIGCSNAGIGKSCPLA